MPFPGSRSLDIVRALAVGLVGYSLYRSLPPAHNTKNTETLRVDADDPKNITTVGARVDAIYHCPGSDAWLTLGNVTIVDKHRGFDEMTVTVQLTPSQAESTSRFTPPCLWKTVAPGSWKGLP